MPSGSNRPKSSRGSNDRVTPPAKTRPAPPSSPASVLQRWGITAEELTKLVDENPSLRGIMLGYVAEHHLTKLLSASDQVSDSLKYDDHDRTKKGDRVVRYKGQRFVIESKSLQDELRQGSWRREVVRQGPGGWERPAHRYVSRRDEAGNDVAPSGRVRRARGQLLRIWRHVAVGFLQEQRPSPFDAQEVHRRTAGRAAGVARQRRLATNGAVHRRHLQGARRARRGAGEAFRFEVFTKTRKYEWFFRACSCFLSRATTGLFVRTTTNRSLQ